MQMLTIRPVALLGLLVIGVSLMGCTVHGDMAKMRRDEAQMSMAMEHGFKPGEAAPAKAAAPAGGGAAASDPVKLGQQQATANGCVACHSVDGKAGVGPTWKGLFDSNKELVSGGPVKADEAYLKESITNPNAKVAKGFGPNVMPATFGSSLKPEQIDQIIAYIKSLK
jgi:cytochrome c2